jgi:hypothetical protein
MSRTKSRSLLVPATILVLLLSTATDASALTGSFGVVQSPNQGTGSNQLLGIGPITATDIWSVGYYNAGFNANSLRTLAQHWDGSAWTVVATPNAATGTSDYNLLRGVAAVSTNSVWAVGYAGNASSAGDRSLIEHWAGAGWQIVPSPNPYTSQHLYGAAAVSATDIWAVGQYFNQSPYRHGALIAHWNGSAWKAIPNPATYDLWGVAALAGNNVWAVGGPQILHWNGSGWRVVPSPQPPCCGSGYSLRALTAISASDIWAVGYAEIPSGEGYVYAPLLEHWNGSTWRIAGGAGGDNLFGVTSLSATSVWAVGVSGGLSFVERFDGTAWTRQPSPNVGTSNNTFEAVGAVSGTGDVWAVGEYYQSRPPFQGRTLVEQCQACG